MAVDLTREFQAACTAAQSSAPATTASETPTTVVTTPAARRKAANNNAKFTAAVGQVAREISHASLKLTKLTRLVKSRSTFNDPSKAINKITVSLKSDLTRLNDRLEDIQGFIESDSGAAQHKQLNVHNLNVVTTLKSQLAMTAKSFQGVLQQRTESLKATTIRQHTFGRERTIGKPLMFTPPRRTPTLQEAIDAQSGDSRLPRPHDSVGAGGGEIDPQDVFSPVNAQALAPEQAYYEARANDVQGLHNHIVELGAMFQRLGKLVTAQGDSLRRLEDNTETAYQNMEAGTEQLTRRLANVSSNKRLALSIFGVLIMFAIFFSIFLA